MIFIDTSIGSKELVPLIRAKGVLCDPMPLSFGDAAFDGNGPDGPISIGIERKALHDMLHCIDDSRYSAHQLPGMAQMYHRSFLIIEGDWMPHTQDGTLMEGFRNGAAWGPCKYRTQRVMYSKLYRYLVSVSLSGVIITYTKTINHTAQNIVELFHYFQKKWAAHTSLMQLQKVNIPTMNGKPSLVRRWANDLEGIGAKYSEEAERRFKTANELANADEEEWLRIPGIGVKTAKSIVREIQGWQK
ncbi:MAG: helix-hairpin-helix domain-containing protein [Nitrospiraceae bacterium]